jgi:hypothetical protein
MVLIQLSETFQKQIKSSLSIEKSKLELMDEENDNWRMELSCSVSKSVYSCGMFGSIKKIGKLEI